MDHREHPAYQRDVFQGQAAVEAPVERVLVRPEVEVAPSVEVRPTVSGPQTVRPIIHIDPTLTIDDQIQAEVEAKIGLNPVILPPEEADVRISITHEQPRWVALVLAIQAALVAVASVVAVLS